MRISLRIEGIGASRERSRLERVAAGLKQRAGEGLRRRRIREHDSDAEATVTRTRQRDVPRGEVLP
jgi:hypothetical protein